MSICNDLAEVKALNGDTYRWDKEPIVEQRAPAKVNLGLKVLGQRADGFHDLLSICQTVNLCDKLTFHAASRDGMECSLRDLEGLANHFWYCVRVGNRGAPANHGFEHGYNIHGLVRFLVEPAGGPLPRDHHEW